MKTAYYAMCIFINVCVIHCGNHEATSSGSGLINASIAGNIDNKELFLYVETTVTAKTTIEQTTGNLTSYKGTTYEPTVHLTASGKTTEDAPQSTKQNETICEQATIEPTVSKIDGSRSPPKIVGNRAKRGRFPYHVALLKNAYQFCSGSLFHANYILTAAHCIHRHARNIEVAAGGLVIGNKGLIDYKRPEWQVRSVESVLIHPKYDSWSMENDIALVYVRKRFQLTSTVALIVLRPPSVRVDANCVVSGWGKIPDEGSRSPDLLFVDVPIIDHEHCKTLYTERRASINTLCAGNVTGGSKDTCQGDSGGPLACGRFANRKFKEYFLTGVVSWGFDCAQSSQPGVYTDVSKYIDWIHQKVRQSRPPRIWPRSSNAVRFSSAGIILFTIITSIFVYVNYT